MPVDAGIALVGAGIAIYGAVKKNQAAKKAQQNLANRPQYNPLPEDDSELNLAEAQAQQGIGAAGQQALQNNTDRTLGTLSNSALMGGADANSVANLADKTENAYNQNAIYNDQVRQQHISTLLNTYAGYNALRQANADKQFQFNKYAPWADQQQLYAQQIAGGQQTMNSGINMFGKAAAGFAGGIGGGDNPNVTDTTPQYNAGTDMTELGSGQPSGSNFVSAPAADNSGWGWNGMSPYYTAQAA